MDIPLPRDLEELVRREVEAGAYESASEMVVEALQLLAARAGRRAVGFAPRDRARHRGLRA